MGVYWLFFFSFETGLHFAALTFLELTKTALKRRD